MCQDVHRWMPFFSHLVCSLGVGHVVTFMFELQYQALAFDTSFDLLSKTDYLENQLPATHARTPAIPRLRLSNQSKIQVHLLLLWDIFGVRC